MGADELIQCAMQVQGASQRAVLSLLIKARRMECQVIMARVDCVAGASAMSGSQADALPPVYAVFSSKSVAELDVGCTVSAQLPLHSVTLPSGERVLLCPDFIDGSMS